MLVIWRMGWKMHRLTHPHFALWNIDLSMMQLSFAKALWQARQIDIVVQQRIIQFVLLIIRHQQQRRFPRELLLDSPVPILYSFVETFAWLHRQSQVKHDFQT